MADQIQDSEFQKFAAARRAGQRFRAVAPPPEPSGLAKWGSRAIGAAGEQIAGLAGIAEGAGDVLGALWRRTGPVPRPREGDDEILAAMIPSWEDIKTAPKRGLIDPIVDTAKDVGSVLTGDPEAAGRLGVDALTGLLTAGTLKSGGRVASAIASRTAAPLERAIAGVDRAVARFTPEPKFKPVHARVEEVPTPPNLPPLRSAQPLVSEAERRAANEFLGAATPVDVPIAERLAADVILGHEGAPSKVPQFEAFPRLERRGAQPAWTPPSWMDEVPTGASRSTDPYIPPGFNPEQPISIQELEFANALRPLQAAIAKAEPPSVKKPRKPRKPKKK